MSAIAPIERIEHAIYLIRGQRVMVDRDLAALYGVSTKALKQTVRRNAKRFPDDFMFELTPDEFQRLRSQIVTSKPERRGGTQYAPMTFTEQGVAMLSGLLNSDRAIEVNILIMRTFVKLRRMLETHAALARKLTEMEQRYDQQFRAVFEALNELLSPPGPPRKPIGFGVREARARYGKPKGREK